MVNQMYIAFTDGWGDEEVLEYNVNLTFPAIPQLTYGTVSPEIFIEGEYLNSKVDTYFGAVYITNRFSESSWLPISEVTAVSILIGPKPSTITPDTRQLETVFWASAFPTREEAEEARVKLRGRK